jgi:hypothetical protein
MSLYQQIFGWLGIAQGFALFGVLLLRSHYRRMPLLALYVGAVRVFGVVYALDPTWEKYMLLQVVCAVLRFGVALELASCFFGAFPAAASTARRILLLILVATAVIAVTTAPAAVMDRRTHAESIPRMANAAIWMFTALAGLVLWYRVPLAPLPRAVLMGYAPYLLVFTIGISLLFDSGSPHLRAWANYVSPLAFFILTNYWLRVAWRTAPESARPVEIPEPAAAARPQPQQAS